MENNFDEKNINGEEANETMPITEPAGEAPAAQDESIANEAEHVISYRESDTPSTYHMTGEQLVRDNVRAEQPSYSAPRAENGNISYTQTQTRNYKLAHLKISS